MLQLLTTLNLTVYSGLVQSRNCYGNDNVASGHCHVNSPTNPGTFDHKNNVEQVIFDSLEIGTPFAIQVSDQAITKDGIKQWTCVSPQQDFAIFIDNVAGF